MTAVITTQQAHKHRIHLYFASCRGCGLVFIQRAECHLPLAHYCPACMAVKVA